MKIHSKIIPNTNSIALIVVVTIANIFGNNVVHGQGLRDDLVFASANVKMPLPISDIMANYMAGGVNGNDDEQGFIIITGGCDSINGNERIQVPAVPADSNNGTETTDDEMVDLFACLSTTNKAFKFDPFTQSITEIANLPNERQRHAAVVIQNELWLLGGRDSNDNVVTAIDSYNPNTDTWTTRGELPNDIATSDLTAWSYEDRYIYVNGGFLQDYTGVTNTYRLDVVGNNDNLFVSSFENMKYETLTSSSTPRGDIHAVTLYGYAYLAGGLSHESLWCEGLTLTERYHMATDTWQTLPNLNIGRADMGVAVLNGKIITIGGETKPDDCLEQSDPAYGSFPDHTVDVLLNADSTDAKWVPFESYIDKRFRFAAAVVPSQSRIYTFGGQLPFDFTCDCFPTSDDIGIGTEVLTTEELLDNEGIDNGSIAAILIGSFVGVIVLGLVLRWCIRARNMEALEARDAHELTVDNGAEVN